LFGIAMAQQYVGDIEKLKNSINNIYEILNEKSLIDPHRVGINCDDNFKGKIEFKNVYFKYPRKDETENEDRMVLINLNFVIEAGIKAAFIGFSGSGKSTIIQLIERFYDCYSGKILIDDVDIKEYNLTSLRKKMSLVTEDPVIFKTDLVNNIKYGCLTCEDCEITKFAKLAFIDHKLSNHSEPISGGEKQRMALARAMIKNPKIFLLDEATSSLDKLTEEKIKNTLPLMLENNTTVMVAHK